MADKTRLTRSCVRKADGINSHLKEKAQQRRQNDAQEGGPRRMAEARRCLGFGLDLTGALLGRRAFGGDLGAIGEGQPFGPGGGRPVAGRVGSLTFPLHTLVGP